jgi:hypothetical protein
MTGAIKIKDGIFGTDAENYGQRALRRGDGLQLFDGRATNRVSQ